MPTSLPGRGDAKSLYGNELPFLNPQDGTVTINGTTLNMGSFREIEARFNKYLSQPEESTEDAKEYQKKFLKSSTKRSPCARKNWRRIMWCGR